MIELSFVKLGNLTIQLIGNTEDRKLEVEGLRVLDNDSLLKSSANFAKLLSGIPLHAMKLNEDEGKQDTASDGQASSDYRSASPDILGVRIAIGGLHCGQYH